MEKQKKSNIELGQLINTDAACDFPVETAFEQYKLCVEMADRISARRQSANSFYLSITTFLLGIVFAGSGTGAINDVASVVLAVAAIAICFLWARSIESYRDLNSGKFAVITQIENMLPLKPYKAEWELLKRGEEHSSYRPFNFIEKKIPLVFSVLLALHVVWQVCGFLGGSPDRGSEAVLQTVQWTV